MKQRKLILGCVLGISVFVGIRQLTAATTTTDEELYKAAEREVAAKVKQMQEAQQQTLTVQPDTKSPTKAPATVPATTLGIAPAMVPIPAGCFQMGSPSTEARRESDESQHQVCVKAFAIGKYEVTFAEYDAFATATGRYKPYDRGWGRDRRPVINIHWDDAVAYAQWLSRQTGKNYRLPTEAEWEHAARAGTTSTYWWGNDIGKNNANCDGCGSKWDNKQTAPVGSFVANPWGLHDTAGNVCEWTTCSEYDVAYSGKENTCVKQGNSDARALRGGVWDTRALRGGAWDSGPDSVRAANRVLVISFRLSDVGFRLVQD